MTQGTSVVRADGMDTTTWRGWSSSRGRRERDASRRSRKRARAMSAATPAGLHHRRLERHRPGAGAALPCAPATAWRWSRGAATRSRAGPSAQGIDAGALRGLRRRRARRRRDHRRRPRLHRRAGRARRRHRQRRHQRRHRHRRSRRPGGDARHLRDQQPRHGRDLPAVRRADARAPLRARWSASPASPASAACPATAPTARARRR